MTASRIHMLRIEIDGHFHGSPNVPKPWVARIDGIHPKYGLDRSFVQKLNDWKGAKRACSGNLYGVVSHFPLRAGNLYEVCRLRGKSSKRYVAREFLRVPDDGKPEPIEPIDALALVEGHDDEVAILRLPDDPDRPPAVRELDGIGSGHVGGWVTIDFSRHYRLRHGRLYEVIEQGERRLVLGGARVQQLEQKEALQWLAAHA